jgi:hypothetical protein
MKKVQKSFAIGKSYFENTETTNIDNFLSYSIEDLLIQHHRRNAENSYFFIDEIKEADRYIFIISQDKELIQDLGMLEINQEKTLDIFESSFQNNFTSITLEKLLKQLELDQKDYKIELNGCNYSFRFAKGIKAQDNLDKIEIYIEEASNILEYKELKKIKI